MAMKTVRSNDQSGNVLFYIFIAVALLGALTYVMARGSGENAQTIQANELAEEIKSQAQTIRSAILECNLVQGFGYPPDDDAPTLMEDVECQIDNTPTMQLLFSGASGRFLPRSPVQMETTGWVYRRDDPDVGDIYIQLSESMNCSGSVATAAAFGYLTKEFSAAEILGTVCDGSVARFRLNIVDVP
jgi:hypothetical protein